MHPESMTPGSGLVMHVLPGKHSGVLSANVLRLVETWKKCAQPGTRRCGLRLSWNREVCMC